MSFTCTFAGCNKAFSRKAILEDHVRAHSNERPYTCSFDCGKTFARSSDCKRHEREQHVGSRFVCEVQDVNGYTGCGRSFSRAFTLKQHMRSCQLMQPSQGTGSHELAPEELTLTGSIEVADEVLQRDISGDQGSPAASPPDIDALADRERLLDTTSLWCMLCGGTRRTALVFDILHTLDHLEEVRGRVFTCPHCHMALPTSYLYGFHVQNCSRINENPFTWECISVLHGQLEIFGRWGCNSTFTDKDQLKLHCIGQDRNPCSRTRNLIQRELERDILKYLLEHLAPSIVVPLMAPDADVEVTRLEVLRLFSNANQLNVRASQQLTKTTPGSCPQLSGMETSYISQRNTVVSEIFPTNNAWYKYR